MPLIELRGISKSFGANTVLQNLDLSVEAGETLVILGRSGIGKSVTLLIITGLLTPDSGQVFLQEQEITRLRERELIPIRRRFGRRPSRRRARCTRSSCRRASSPR